MIANHTSWLDIMYGIHHFFSGFVAKSAVKKMPGVGVCADIIGSVYIDRVGNTKDSRKAVLDAIGNR
jgi:1-acyl-sn-glycerol-3-phosphate acyltransferase